jgi:hypothetical protein
MELADGAPLDILREEVLRPDLIDRVIDEVWRGLSRPDDTAARRAKVEAEIGRVEREIANLTNALASCGDVQSRKILYGARMLPGSAGKGNPSPWDQGRPPRVSGVPCQVSSRR